MASNYAKLLDFVRQNASDPVELAKALTNWAWASLLPGGYGPTPETNADVPAGLNASCGWRDVLMKGLFAEIGIEGRRVNFYDVPYQGGHTATELKIGGKWMFFDATFGVYFTAKGSNVPLSIAEVFQQWPNVDVMQSTLDGWQGKFLSPGSIDPAAYATVTDYALYMPHDFHGVDGVLGGEINSLYLGPNTAYYVNNEDIPVPSGHFTWKERVDTSNNYDWYKITDRYYDGKLDTRSGLYDNGARWFVDYDQRNEYAWASETTYVTANSRIDSRTTVFDDGSYRIIDWDATNRFDWKRIEDHYDQSGVLTSRTIENDDGSVLMPSIISVAQAGGSVIGTAGDDLIVGFEQPGSATVDGGDGMDTALFSGARSGYGLIFSGTGLATIKYGAVSHDLSSVEALAFSDQTVLIPYQTLTDTDDDAEFSWTSVTSSFDYSGRLLSVSYDKDDGTVQQYSYDVLGQFNWSRTISTTGDDGRKLLDIYDNDNGTRVIYQYDASGGEDWSRITRTLDKLEQTQSVNYTFKDKTSVIYQYDSKEANSWEEITNYVTSSGARDRVIYQNDDGSTTVYNYDVNDLYSWSSTETRFGRDGIRDSVIYNRDDGNHTLYQFSSDGLTIASEHNFGSDWLVIA